MPSRGMGWRPQKPDRRDFLYAPPPQFMRSLPPRALVREDMIVPIYDQGDLGSCTGNSVGAADHIEWLKQGIQPPAIPSRLMIYYGGRQIEGTTDWDAGAELRDVVKSLAAVGTCYEDLWPYDVTQFATQPSAAAYSAAARDKALYYYALIQNTRVMRSCIADGYPFVFGFTVYDSFMTDAVAANGIVPMPSGSDAPVGGHAVLAVGYDDSDRMFTCRNSWGAGWGDKGRFYIPYEYLGRGDLSSDFWTLRRVG